MSTLAVRNLAPRLRAVAQVPATRNVPTSTRLLGSLSGKTQLPIGSPASPGLSKPATVDARVFPAHYSSSSAPATSHPSADLQATDISITFPSSPSQPITLPYVWLRDSCPCPSCVHSSTRQKLHRTSDVPLDIKPKRVTWVRSLNKDARWALEVEWNQPLWKHDTASTGIEGHATPDGRVGGEGHRSQYSERWLKTWSDEGKVKERNHDPALAMVPWLAKDLVAEGGNSRLFFSYEEVQKDEKTLLGALKQLTNYGVTVLRDVPTTTTGNWELNKVANLFSYVRETFYGPLWDVKSLPMGVTRNVAYTDLDLDLHMDLLYFENPPRYQLLHCLRNRNVTGGQSIFVDAVQAAQTLWKEDREAFDLLATTDVGFHYVNDGHHLAQRHKTIVVDPSSDLSSPPKITAINYSPPFQSPLPTSTPPAFYQALQKFAATLRRPEGRWEYLLKEGDLVLFDNRRVLHARRAFTGGSNGTSAETKKEGECNRWLKGCYVEADAVADRIRVLRAKLGVE